MQKFQMKWQQGWIVYCPWNSSVL